MTENIREGWKILTHDFRPPIQGGEPLFGGNYPFTTPKVTLDTSEQECGTGGGWHFCKDIQTCFKIAGMWRDGWAANISKVLGSEDSIERRDKRRTSSVQLLREATDEEVRTAMFEFSKSFGKHQSAMAAEQFLWFQALKRPNLDIKLVKENLRISLDYRGLQDWKLKEFSDAWVARVARDARDAWVAWDAWDAWDAWVARDAQKGLDVYFASISKWINYPPDLLTKGIRDAHKNGLWLAIPTGPKELGFVMVKK